jgi:hypothetical protein
LLGARVRDTAGLPGARLAARFAGARVARALCAVAAPAISTAVAVFGCTRSVCVATARAALATFAVVALTVARVAGSPGLFAAPVGCVAGGGFAAACASIVGFNAPGGRRLGRARSAAVAAVIFATGAPSVAVAFVGNATALV